MVDHLVRTALAKGHIQSVCDQFASQVVGHGPADDAATEGVYDPREVEEARMGRHIGDIGYPQPVPDWSAEGPVDQVRSLPAFFGSPCGAYGSAARHPAERTKRIRRATLFNPTRIPESLKFRMDAPKRHGTVGALMDQADLVQQHDIASGPFRCEPQKPAIVATGGGM